MYAYLTKSSEKREGGITYRQISLDRDFAPIMPTCMDCRTEPSVFKEPCPKAVQAFRRMSRQEIGQRVLTLHIIALHCTYTSAE